jgi:acetyl esterase
MTYDEKLKIAEQLRSSSVVQTYLSPEMEGSLDRVDWKEEIIPTREGDSRVILVSPRTVEEPCPLFINMHGGGFVRGYEKRDTVFSALLAESLGCKVIDIDYRLAPEHPFPSALNECYDVVKWSFDHADFLKIDRKRIALGGHSAGGNFTAAIALMANQTRDFSLCLQILDYPFLDAVTDPAEKAEPENLLPVERMRFFSRLYMENEEDYSNPFFSLVCATPEMLKGLPPALIITAGKDCLRKEAERYAMMLIHAGVDVRMRCFLESNHGFIIHGLAEYREARNLIINALEEAFK